MSPFVTNLPIPYPLSSNNIIIHDHNQGAKDTDSEAAAHQTGGAGEVGAAETQRKAGGLVGKWASRQDIKEFCDDNDFRNVEILPTCLHTHLATQRKDVMIYRY